MCIVHYYKKKYHYNMSTVFWFDLYLTFTFVLCVISHNVTDNVSFSLLFTISHMVSIIKYTVCVQYHISQYQKCHILLWLT